MSTPDPTYPDSSQSTRRLPQSPLNPLGETEEFLASTLLSPATTQRARRVHLIAKRAFDPGPQFGAARRFTFRVLFLSLAVLIGGCTSAGFLRRQVYAKPIHDDPTVHALEAMYTNWTQSASNVWLDANPKGARNRVIHDLMRLSDHRYEEFKAKLYVGDAGGNSALDLASIGLTTAAGVIGGGTGQILALTDTAVKGSQGKLMERWLNNKAMRVVVLAMDASRAELRTQLHEGMKREHQDFSIEMGLEIVARYHAAASLPNALTYLEATMGERNREAERSAVQAQTNSPTGSGGK